MGKLMVPERKPFFTVTCSPSKVDQESPFQMAEYLRVVSLALREKIK